MRSLAAGVGILVLAGCAAPAIPETAGGQAGELTGTVTVLAAASLTDVFDDLAARFEQRHPQVEIVLSFGGSSALAEQLLSGAPADLVATADESTMSTLVDAGLVVGPEPFATNVLALAVPAGNPGGVTGLSDLADPRLAIALCDPTVPCGKAAERLLAREGVVASVDTFGEDARAVLTKVVLGEVDAALVYRTDVRAAGADVEELELPEADSVVNRYPIARLADSRNPRAAQAFLDLVLGEVGREGLAHAGFGLP